MTKAIHVKRTWGSRCDILLFMSSTQGLFLPRSCFFKFFLLICTAKNCLDDRLPTIALPGVEEGHTKLWPKTQKALKYVYEHHRHDADWFLKADDDTFIFTGNLRAFLKNFKPDEPHYMGCQLDFYPNDKRNTMINAGGAGKTSFRSCAITSIAELNSYCANK